MTYVLVFIAALLCELACSVPMGSMPLALTSTGASPQQVAVVMGAGALAALCVSIPLGVLVDRVGRLPVMKVSIFGCALTLVMMGIFHDVLSACFEMALRSFWLIAFVTAQFAYVSGMFSKERMVSAVASMGIVGNIAFACGPAFGVWLWQQGVHHEQYIWSAGLSLLAALIIMFLPGKYDLAPSGSSKRRRPVAFRRAWMPAVVFLVFVSLQAGVNFALAVLAFQERGIANGALLFTAAAFTTVLFRYFAGRCVEKYGASNMSIPTAIFQATGCIMAASAMTPQMVLLSGIFLGSAWAAVPPIGMALLFEHSSQRTRGVAMGAYSLAMWGGIALGSLVATVATSLGFGYREAIVFCALSPFVAVLYLFANDRKRAAILNRA